METDGSQNIVVEERHVDEKDKERNLEKLAKEVLEMCREASLAIPPECYGFVERCLRVKDYDVKKTVKLLLQFDKSVKDLNHLFAKHDTKNCATVHQSGVLTALKGMDEFGRQVLLYRFGHWRPKDIDCDQLLTTAILFFLRNVGESKVVQRNGTVTIADLKSLGIEHLRRVSMKTLTQFVSVMNDSAPGKIKAIHIINHPRIFGPLFNLLKPFLKEKLSKRIRFHGDSTSSLQQFFKPEILPESLGGILGEREAEDGELVKRFVSDESYCNELIRLGFPKQ